MKVANALHNQEESSINADRTNAYWEFCGMYFHGWAAPAAMFSWPHIWIHIVHIKQYQVLNLNVNMVKLMRKIVEDYSSKTQCQKFITFMFSNIVFSSFMKTVLNGIVFVNCIFTFLLIIPLLKCKQKHQTSKNRAEQNCSPGLIE